MATFKPFSQGRLGASVETLEAALVACEKAFGPEHITTLVAVGDLGAYYYSTGRLRDAEMMFLWASRGLEKTLGRTVLQTLEQAIHLGLVYTAQGRAVDAEKTYKQALEDLQKVFGPNHLMTLTTANNLGHLYKDVGLLDEAETMFKWALQGLEKTCGPMHSSTLNTANGIGMVYKHQGKLHEAKAMFQRALRGFEETLGPDDPSTLDAVNNLGNVYLHQDRPMMAEQMYIRAKNGFEKARGWHDRSTLNAANNLRLLYDQLGRRAEAERISKWICDQHLSTGGNYLQSAARNGHVDIVRLLVINGVDVNNKGRHQRYSPTGGAAAPPGSTALHIAVYHGYIQVVMELLNLGADVNATCHWDQITPLNVAVTRNDLNIARLLLDRGANGNGITGAGHPPLLDAATRGHVEMATLLLQRGAEVDAIDTNGDPVLHSAAYCNKINIVRLLLDHGANPRSNGGSGRTARWFAAQRGYEEVVALLRSRGADDSQKPDMLDDSSVALNSIGSDKILADLEKAQHLRMSESVSEEWVKQLRFVVRGTGPHHDLELILENGGSTPEPFVAISYCWGSASNANNQKPLTIYDSRGEGRSRLIRTSTDTILRSLKFAESRGIRRIWIDQECIDQGDEMDVQAAIQSMHLVYRRADAILVLLGKHIHAKEDLEVMTDTKLLLMTSNSSESVDQILRDRILGDKWFTRAWCAQEYANSEEEKLFFLVGTKHDFDEDGSAWRDFAEKNNAGPNQPKQYITKEWVLTQYHVWSMSFHSPRNSHVLLGNVASRQVKNGASGGFTLLDNDFEKSNFIKTQRSYSVALRMTFSQAYATLRLKKNLLVSDRLAILSNMAHYRSRINTRKAVDQGLSYTACMLSLALNNGDLTSLGFCRGVGCDKNSSAVGSWLPHLQTSLDKLVPEGQAALQLCHDSDPVYVIGGKGLLRGLIWDIEAYSTSQFSDLREVLPDMLELAGGNLPESEESSLWRRTLLQLLIRQLHSAGYWDLLEVIALCAMPRILKDPEEMHSILSALNVWIRGQDDDSWPDFSSSSSSHVGSHINPLLQSPLDWIYDCIGSIRPLPVGRCVVKNKAGDSRTLLGLFRVDPAETRQVFTLLSGLEYTFGAWMSLSSTSSYFCGIEEVSPEFHLSEDDFRKAVELLRSGDLLTDRKVYRVRGIGHPMAVWSHRLSRNGILEKDDQEGWATVPLGKGMFSFLKMPNRWERC